MVFEPEPQFQQLLHSKFGETAVRLLPIPTLDQDQEVFLIVSKNGKVGLYEPGRWTLFHTYVLDLTLPMAPHMSNRTALLAKHLAHFPPPKCHRTHLVVDAVHIPHIRSVIYLTTRGILQCYDLGEIETQSWGLELFGGKRFMGMKNGVSPLEVRNEGHVETHRIFGLPPFPTCMEYYAADGVAEGDKTSERRDLYGRILVGNSQGSILIISLNDPRKPFGWRKIRNMLHEINIQDLKDVVTTYRAHLEPISELKFLTRRGLLISSSRDPKFSLFVKDLHQTAEPYIISLPRGVNTFAHSDSLRAIATGSEDLLVRLFNQFVVKMPQMELSGHRAPVVALDFLHVPFSQTPILLSYSQDVEVRAWDPLKYVCLQAIYISFPPKSTLLSRSPTFAHHSLHIYQPQHSAQKATSSPPSQTDISSNESKSVSKKCASRRRVRLRAGVKKGLEEGAVVVLYCNSVATLRIQPDTSHWPFQFQDLDSDLAPTKDCAVERSKEGGRQTGVSQDPNRPKLSAEEMERLESELDTELKQVLGVKRDVERRLARASLPTPSVQTSERLGALSSTLGAGGMSQTEFVKEGEAFVALPLVPMEPLEFLSKGLPLTEAMRGAGMEEVGGVKDLLSPEARSCFSEQNVRRLSEEAELLEKGLVLAEKKKHRDMFGYDRQSLATRSPHLLTRSGSSKPLPAHSASPPVELMEERLVKDDRLSSASSVASTPSFINIRI